MKHISPYVSLVVSGGESGAERGGLDFAIEHGIPHQVFSFDGFVPRLKEDLSGYNVQRLMLQGTKREKTELRIQHTIREADITFLYFSLKHPRARVTTFARRVLWHEETVGFVCRLAETYGGAAYGPEMSMPLELARKFRSPINQLSAIHDYSALVGRRLIMSVLGSHRIPARAVSAHLNKMNREGFFPVNPG